jgi:hypothetical protein
VTELARLQWADGARRLDQANADGVRYRQLCELVDVVVDELRKRIGLTFTLDRLAEVHDGADPWVRDVVADAIPPAARVGPADTVLVLDAACYRYARGAEDYRP